MILLVYCSAGFGMEMMDLARRVDAAGKRWDQMAFLDDACAQQSVYGAEVHRFDAALQRFGAPGMEVVIANGEPFIRQALREKVSAAGVRLATLVDPTAVLSPRAQLGAGAVVYPGCFVSSEAMLGTNSVMIAGALVGHHSVVGDDCVLAGHVNVGGGCTIGHRSYVGMGAQIRQLTRVGSGTVVGMGSIVFADIPDEVVALGNPCRPMRANTSRRVFS